MKKKIVFYGNCQLSVLSNTLCDQSPQFNESYEILRASDYNLRSIWKEPKSVVAPFMYLPNKQNEGFSENVLNSINKIMDDADIIVCQDFKEDIRCRPTEVTSAYIHDKYYKEKQVVCLPVLWFSGYLTEPYHDSDAMMPYIYIWLIENGYDNQKILNWLKNEYDPKIANLIEYAASNSIDKNKQKQKEESAKFKNYINTIDVLEEYKDNLIVTRMNHPTAYYYGKLYQRFIQFLDSGFDTELNIDKIIFPGGGEMPNLFDFNFFKKIFPNIKRSRVFRFPLDINFVNKQVDIAKTIQEDIDFLLDIENQLNILRS